jgi:peptide/nickel transport system substrate-binding protein
MRRLYRLLLILAAVTLSGAAAAAPDANTLVRRLEADVTTLNPLVGPTAADVLVAKYLFTPLLYLDHDLRPVPGLAKSWKVDNRTYRFVLNEKATFSDGRKVRARDVLFTFRKLADPKAQAFRASSFAHIDWSATRAIDDTTIEIVFSKALAGQLSRFADVFILPEHVYSKRRFIDDYLFTAIGSGPYRLVRRTVRDAIVLERRDDYWREKPLIKTVVFKVVEDYTTAWNALKTGQIDESYIPTTAWLRERNDAMLRKRLEFHFRYVPEYNAIAWNTQRPLLRDKRVRRALAMAVPLADVVRQYYGDTARAISGPFTPQEAAYNHAVGLIPYSPTGAKQLFADAGWQDRNGDGLLDKEGKRFELTLIVPNDSLRDFAEIIQSYLLQAGVRLHVTMMDPAAMGDHLEEGNYDAVYMAWTNDDDPDLYVLFHSSQIWPRGRNDTRFANAHVDKLIEQARSESDETKRLNLYHRLHELIADEQPYGLHVQVSLKWGINKRVRGVRLSERTGLFLWYPGPLAWSIQP